MPRRILGGEAGRTETRPKRQADNRGEMVRRNHRATVYLCWIRSRDLIWLAQQQEHRECATPNSAAVALFAALSGLYLRVTK